MTPDAYTALKFAASAAGYQARIGTLTEPTVRDLITAAERLPEHEELAAAIASFAVAFEMRHVAPGAVRDAGEIVCETIRHLNLADVGDRTRRVTGD